MCDQLCCFPLLPRSLSLSLCLSGPPLQEASCLITGFTSAERTETHKSKFLLLLLSENNSSASVDRDGSGGGGERERERSRSHKVKEQEGNENSKFLKKIKRETKRGKRPVALQTRQDNTTVHIFCVVYIVALLEVLLFLSRPFVASHPFKS